MLLFWAINPPSSCREGVKKKRRWGPTTRQGSLWSGKLREELATTFEVFLVIPPQWRTPIYSTVFLSDNKQARAKGTITSQRFLDGATVQILVYIIYSHPIFLVFVHDPSKWSGSSVRPPEQSQLRDGRWMMFLSGASLEGNRSRLLPTRQKCTRISWHCAK